MIVRELDVQGFHSIMAVVPRGNLVTIFLKAESEEKLLAQIAMRGQLPAEELDRRMQSARTEMAAMGEFDYQVLSLTKQIPKLVDDVVVIIKDECGKAGLKV